MRVFRPFSFKIFHLDSVSIKPISDNKLIVQKRLESHYHLKKIAV